MSSSSEWNDTSIQHTNILIVHSHNILWPQTITAAPPVVPFIDWLVPHEMIFENTWIASCTGRANFWADWAEKESAIIEKNKTKKYISKNGHLGNKTDESLHAGSFAST